MSTPIIFPQSVTVPRGGSADVIVSWLLDPGSADVSGTLALIVDGVPVTIPVVHEGRAPEQAPTLVLSEPKAGDVLVVCDVATVSLVDQGTIRLS